MVASRPQVAIRSTVGWNAMPYTALREVSKSCVRAAVAPEMAVVVADDLVLLKVPALDLLVLATREQIWVPVAHHHSTRCADVPCDA